MPVYILDIMLKQTLYCQWNDCGLAFESADELYNHLSDDHVGRKSTNNLCLQCHWNNCGTVAAKRDHLASHIRVHLPFKRKYSKTEKERDNSLSFFF